MVTAPVCRVVACLLPSFHRYQFTLLGSWTTCPELLPDSDPAGNRTHDHLIWSPTPYRYTTKTPNPSYLLRYVIVAVPGQPSNLQGVPVSASDIRLSWDHPAGAGDSIVSYELYYNDSLQRRGIHVTISPAVNAYLLSDLSPNTVYHIRLSARSLRGEGVPTATIQVRTQEYGISHVRFWINWVVTKRCWDSVLKPFIIRWLFYCYCNPV